MIGLLGGLLGRAASSAFSRRPMGGGPLSGLLANRGRMMARRGGFMSGPGGASPAQAPAPQQAQRQGQPQQPQPQAATGQQQQIQPAGLDGTQPTTLDLIAPDGTRPDSQAAVTAGLLEDAPAFGARPDPGPEEVAPPQQVANQTEAMTPVAPQEDQQFGAIPALLAPGLEGVIGEEPPRREFAMEDPNPTKPVDTKSQARYGQAGPQYGFQTMGSWTSLSPSYTYRR